MSKLKEIGEGLVGFLVVAGMLIFNLFIGGLGVLVSVWFFLWVIGLFR